MDRCLLSLVGSLALFVALFLILLFFLVLWLAVLLFSCLVLFFVALPWVCSWRWSWLPPSFFTGPSSKLLHRVPINRIMHFYDPRKALQNCRVWLKLGPVGCARASGDMVGSFWSNYHPWGCSGARVMTIFGSHIGPHFLILAILKYMEVYKGI